MANNAYQVVRDFEEAIAEWTGAKYGVAVESGTAALFLSLQWRKLQYPGVKWSISIPSRTYPSVPNVIIQSGMKVNFIDYKWNGTYSLDPLRIVDGALRFRKGMYIPHMSPEGGALVCLSFHLKKNLPIGRGGMILTDSGAAYEWFKMARFDGRKEEPLEQMADPIIGWNMYMTPEQAARGLQLFHMVKNKDLPDLKVDEQGYPDLSKFKAYQ